MDTELELFCARHVPERARGVPGILARRLWQLNRQGLWAVLHDLEGDNLGLRPGRALRCITLLPHEYGAEGLPGSMDVGPGHFIYTDSSLDDTIRTLALNGHRELLEAICQYQTRERRYRGQSTVPEAHLLSRLRLTREDVDAVARQGNQEMLEVLHRYAPGLFSPFAQEVRDLIPTTTLHDDDEDPNATIVELMDGRPPGSEKNAGSSDTSPAYEVLTTSALVSTIGAFQFDIHKWIDEVQPLYKVPDDKTIDEVVGILPRLAIIQSDEFALRRLYRLSILPKYSSIPKFSFVNAMHDAATEGHLRMLQWLHTLCPRLSCRPDTMAMTVRSGWADVVEWLCEHARESASLSMTDAPVCDAARWGFVDVLRVLHEHGDDAWFSPKVMDAAAASGQLLVVQWLHANRSEGCTTMALDGAIHMNHVDVIKWLHANRTEGCSKAAMSGVLIELTGGPLIHTRQEMCEWLLANRHEGCTGGGLCYGIASGDDRQLDIVLNLWSRSRDDPGADAAITSGFRHACSVARVDYIELLLERLGDFADVQAGIMAASTTQNRAVIEYLAPLVSPEVAIGAAVNSDLGHVLRDAVLRIREVDGSFELGGALRSAIRGQKRSAIRVLIELGIDRECPDALSLAVDLMDSELVELLLAVNQTANSVLRALPKANTVEMAQLLLQHDSMVESDMRQVLEALPSCMATRFLRFVAQHGRLSDVIPAIEWTSSANGPDSLLLDELATISAMEDPDLDAFVSRHHETVVDPGAMVKAAADGALELMRYLHARGVSVPPRAFAPAVARNRLAVVEWMLSVGIVPPPKVLEMAARNPERVVSAILARVDH